MAAALVTGANRGIGLEICKQLHAKGLNVYGACRSTSPALDALSLRGGVIEGIDVASDSVGDALRSAVGDIAIDVLICNAGVLTVEGLSDLASADKAAEALAGMRRQFEVNSLGPIKIAAALAGNLVDGRSKVAITSSAMGSIAENGSGGMYGYRMSKAAVNIGGVSLARDLAPRNICVQVS